MLPSHQDEKNWAVTHHHAQRTRISASRPFSPRDLVRGRNTRAGTFVPAAKPLYVDAKNSCLSLMRW